MSNVGGRINNYGIRNIFSEKFLQIKSRILVDGEPAELTAEGSDRVQRFAFDKKAASQFAMRSLFSGKVLDITDNRGPMKVSKYISGSMKGIRTRFGN